MSRDGTGPITLMQFWRLHRDGCRPIGSIVADARSGALPGVKPLESGFGFEVIDSNAALSAMRKATNHFVL